MRIREATHNSQHETEFHEGKGDETFKETKSMKTVVIWDEMQGDIQFFVVEGKDLSHLSGKYVNGADNTEEVDSEISNLCYDENGQKTVEMSSEFPINEVKAGASVIVLGFLP